MQTYDALVLAGGRGRRLGGVDKASLVVGGETLLGRALSAVTRAERVMVIGPPSASLRPGVRFVSEEPPGGGPVAAIAAGMAYVDARVVVILACDMPLVTSPVVESLVERLTQPLDTPSRAAGPKKIRQPSAAAIPEGQGAPLVSARPDGVTLVDAGGRRQPLAAAYRTEALRAALQKLGAPENTPVLRLVSPLTIAELPVDALTTLDCDTWSDVEHCRDLLAATVEER